VLQKTEFFISKRAGKAITDYHMIDDQDKILVAVSGGKDSLTLLRILEDRRRFVPIQYQLLAVHVDSGYPRSFSKALVSYFKKLGVPYHIEKIDIRAGLKRDGKEMSCFWCSWNRRKALFEAADRLGCNRVALGHHKDDIVQTILLNMFFNGEISSMCPKQEMFGGKLTIIRPLAYVEERLIGKFAREVRLPVQECECPHGRVSNRAEMARIISRLERIYPDVKTNIFRSVSRIKTDYLPNAITS
jgi:tRNA 2-thiocytidine biosynthesis protein TtcA